MITQPPARHAPEPVRLSPGLVAFVAVMVAPAVIATAIVTTAWAVSDEVYAAERVAASTGGPPPVAAWKSTVVVICPIH